MRISMMLKR